MSKSRRLAYLLVDGENIDRTLGQILGKKPKPEQRPRWDRIKSFIEENLNVTCRGLFFLNASGGVSGPFIQALKSAGFIPIPLTGEGDQKVVDLGIIKTLSAINRKLTTTPFPELTSVVLMSHDSDFKEEFSKLADMVSTTSEGLTSLCIVGFHEYISGSLLDIEHVRVFDLERDIHAFNEVCGPLPRTRTVAIEDFDPIQYL